jgi:thioredoxin-like negative regulator of GroEL
MKKSVFLHSIVFITASTQSIHASIIPVANEEEFNKIVQSNTPSVVVFSADWCPACKNLKHPLHNVSNKDEFKHIVFAEVDIDKHPDLAKQYKLDQEGRGVPTVIFTQGGQQKHEIVGPTDAENSISAAIRESFGAGSTTTMQTAAQEKLAEVAQDMKEAAATAGQKLEDVAHKAEEKIAGVVEEIKETAAQTGASLAQEQTNETESGFMKFFNGLMSAIVGAFTWIKDMLVDLVSKIKGLFSK